MHDRRGEDKEDYQSEEKEDMVGKTVRRYEEGKNEGGESDVGALSSHR